MVEVSAILFPTTEDSRGVWDMSATTTFIKYSLVVSASDFSGNRETIVTSRVEA